MTRKQLLHTARRRQAWSLLGLVLWSLGFLISVTTGGPWWALAVVQACFICANVIWMRAAVRAVRAIHAVDGEQSDLRFTLTCEPNTWINARQRALLLLWR